MKIKINNKSHDVKIGGYAISLFEDAENVELLSGAIPLKYGMFAKLVYYGLVAEGVECELKDVFNAFDKDATKIKEASEYVTKVFESLNALDAEAKK